MPDTSAHRPCPTPAESPVPPHTQMPALLPHPEQQETEASRGHAVPQITPRKGQSPAENPGGRLPGLPPASPSSRPALRCPSVLAKKGTSVPLTRHMGSQL